MGDLSPSELACEERSRKSPSTLANVPESTGLRVDHGSGVFASKDLLPGYASQRISASEVHSVAVFARRSSSLRACAYTSRWL